MLALETLRLLAFGAAWTLLHRRARRDESSRSVWGSHAVAVGVLALGSLVHLVLSVAGVPGHLAVIAFGVSTLPACLFSYRGLIAHNRLHAVGADAADWLLGTSCAFSCAAVLNLLVQAGIVSTPLHGVELQHRLLTVSAVAVVVATTAVVARLSGVLRNRSTIAVLVSGLLVLGFQVRVATAELSPATRVLLSVAWIAYAFSLAHAATARPVPRPVITRPLSSTPIAFGALLAAVAVITATSVEAGHGPGHGPGLRWSVVWAVLAVLGLFGRISQVVRNTVHHDRSRREASTDELTGLANRRAFTRALEEVGGQEAVALLLVDLDRFKEVNDRHGHATGDRLLQHVARTFSAALPAGALLARLGGDEFAVLLRGEGRTRALEVAGRLAAAAADAPLDGVHVVEASVGVATTGPGAGSVPGADLLRRADAAMYVAKAAGGGVAEHDEDLDARLRRRAALTDDVVAALSPQASPPRRAAGGEDRFRVLYQPQLSIRTGEVVGVEALVRWHHPHLGVLPPLEFLGIVEERGLMPQLTAHVVRRASADLAAWRAQGFDLRLSFNVSAGELTRPGLLELLDDVVAAGTDPARLVVEVTETTLMQDPEKALDTCYAITARGCALSIDDFGTGYSSLAYLADLPASEVKIDRSFTARAVGDERTAAVIAGTVDLAHHLGLRVVAEGVEDAATLARLGAIGCDESQGYLHSRPVPAGELLDWMRARRAGALVP